MLGSFSGVLVSDFYSAYNAIDCPQQKCLIHFIRDLNDELLKHPYDDGLNRLGRDFAGLVKPMVETVDRRGLKKRFLGKHRSSVDRFYKGLDDKFGSGEAANKIIDRLQRNRNKMFTFLNFDDVPWNNNNAEHAIKAFAVLRRVIEGKTTEKSLRDFLVLLSLCETCKCRSVDFLSFLRSGAKDVNDFASYQGKGNREQGAQLHRSIFSDHMDSQRDHASLVPNEVLVLRFHELLLLPAAPSGPLNSSKRVCVKLLQAHF
jgi:hypothetical protein